MQSRTSVWLINSARFYKGDKQKLIYFTNSYTLGGKKKGKKKSMLIVLLRWEEKRLIVELGQSGLALSNTTSFRESKERKRKGSLPRIWLAAQKG